MPRQYHSYFLEGGSVRSTTSVTTYDVPAHLDIDAVLKRVNKGGSEPFTTGTLFATTKQYHTMGHTYTTKVEIEWYNLGKVGIEENEPGAPRYFAYETWEVRPYLEGVFYEDYLKFQELVRKLIDSRGENIASAREAFLDKLANEKGDLSAPELLAWDDAQKQLFEAMLDKIELTALKGKIQAHDKKEPQSEMSQLAGEMVERLRRKIEKFSPQSEDLNTRKLKILNFKLDLIRTLRSHDHIFNQHSDYKRLLTNLLTILLTGALANAINWCFTGDFLFCNQPDSQKQVMSAQQSLGFFAQDVPRIVREPHQILDFTDVDWGQVGSSFS